MVITKDRPHGSGRSIPMFIEVECEDHSAIQAPHLNGVLLFVYNQAVTAWGSRITVLHDAYYQMFAIAP